MRFVILMGIIFGTLGFSSVCIARAPMHDIGEIEFYGINEGYAVESVEIDLVDRNDKAMGFTIRSDIVVASPCFQVRYDVYHQGSHEHYIDYYLEVTGELCIQVTTERSASINLGKLAPGLHTVSVMGPDGKDLRIKFEVEQQAFPASLSVR